MKFFNEVGKMALGTRVRFLGERISAEAAEIYKAYGTDLNPKWFPVFYVLSKGNERTVTSIAERIGHSHASVSKIVGEMSRAGLVLEKTDAKDRRRTNVALSKKGVEVARKIENQYTDVNAAVEELFTEATHNLWEALEEWEYLLEQKPLRERVLGKKKVRESAAVKIVPYQPKYQKAFRDLNEEWITTYFKMEKPDYDALDHPKKYILERGGFIFVALSGDKPVGVCALIKRDDLKAYELAKMAVSPEARGKNIGYLLGKAVIEKAQALKADRLFLESNTILKPAINLYLKLGFQKIVGPPTPYERCNIQMELKLKRK
jgi:DNA-binding MarR family transcriptional regulator/GNAT superfamily N-acetyltransferase